jgi:dCMP deaminase
MCKRLVINSGIETVVIRDTAEEYRVIRVADWVEDDESLELTLGY